MNADGRRSSSAPRRASSVFIACFRPTCARTRLIAPRQRLGGRLAALCARRARRSAGWRRGLAGERVSRRQDRPRAARGGPARGARRPEGAADEGGADALHHPRRAARGIRPASWSQLQANAPSMGWPFVKRRMAARAGAGLAEALRALRARRRRAPPRSARCIARTAHDGALLACKLQYPDMQSAVEADLRQLKLDLLDLRALRPRRSRPRRSTPRSPRGCARSSTTSARRSTCALRPHAARTRPASMCRRSIAELSTQRLLTMTWLDGAAAAADHRRRTGARACATRSRSTCSAPGTCRSTTTA